MSSFFRETVYIKKSASANKTLSALLFFLSFFFCLTPIDAGTAEGESFKIRMRQSLKRGILNMASAPLEIPRAVQESHERAGYPVVRHTVGLFEGAFRTVHRFGSGLWDFLAAFLPGRQKAIAIEPEVLF